MSARPLARPGTLRSIEEHREIVLAGARPLEPLDVALLDARGCLLAEDVAAPWPLPAFDSALGPGYAVRSADVASAGPARPAALVVVDDVPAGYRASRPLGAGTAIRIGSGALIPEGADAVVPLSDTDAGMPTVAVRAPVVAGAGIRRTGSHVPEGARVLTVGTRVGSREVGLLASVGQARVRVHPKPRVVVISTGTELVEPGAPTTPGLVPDATGFLLTSAVEAAGGLAYRAGQVADEVEALTSALEDQLVRADLIITTGGVTLSAYDTLHTVLDRIGDVELARVAVEPGGVQGYGRVGAEQVPILLLPGVPAAAFVAFELFVRPVIRRMLGSATVVAEPVDATLTSPVAGHAGSRRHVPGRLRRVGGDRQVTAVHDRGLPGLQQANCLIVVGEGQSQVAAGGVVPVIPLVGGA